MTPGVNFVLMIDLEKASREELIFLNSQLLAQLQLLQERIKQLEAELQNLRGGPPSNSSTPIRVKPSRSPRKKKKRKARPHGFARKLDTVTSQIEHKLEHCPQCQVALTGRHVIKTRRLIELPAVQTQVVEHLLVERSCPECQKRWKPVYPFALS